MPPLLHVYCKCCADISTQFKKLQQKQYSEQYHVVTLTTTNTCRYALKQEHVNLFANSLHTFVLYTHNIIRQ